MMDVFLSKIATKKIIKKDMKNIAKAMRFVIKNNDSAFSDKNLKLKAELSIENRRKIKLNIFTLKTLAKSEFVSVER